MNNGTEPSLPLDIPEQSEVISGQKVGYARVSCTDRRRWSIVRRAAGSRRSCGVGVVVGDDLDPAAVGGGVFLGKQVLETHESVSFW